MLYKIIIQKQVLGKSNPKPEVARKHRRVVVVEAESAEAAEEYLTGQTSCLDGCIGIIETQPMERPFVVVAP